MSCERVLTQHEYYLRGEIASLVSPAQKHSFEVHAPDFYTQRLRQMMGEAWYEPVYLDNLGLPHIDLIKLIWLLNAVAPAWAT